MSPLHACLRSSRAAFPLVAFLAFAVVLAACGGDDADDDTDIATEPESTPTEIPVEAEATPEPTVPVATGDDATVAPTQEPEPTTEPTPEPTPEPAEDVELAPELAGLTDWRNQDPVTLEDLRGQPVVLVFWNSL